MNDSPEKEMKELMEGIADDLEYEANNENLERRQKPPDSKSQRKILALWSGVILLLIVIIALLFGGGKEVGPEKSVSIKPRLDQIEDLSPAAKQSLQTLDPFQNVRVLVLDLAPLQCSQPAQLQIQDGARLRLR